VDYSGLRSRRKNDTAAALPPLLLVFMSVALVAVGFHECGSGCGALVFHGSGFWSFSHINILLTWCASS